MEAPSPHNPEAPWADYSSEIELNLTLPIAKLRPSTGNGVLVTGANGYLGASILIDLIHMTNLDVHCLLRGKDPEEVRKKLTIALLPFDLDRKYYDRIYMVIGDLDKPKLGMEADDYNKLSTKVSAIYHSGADVNFEKTYNQLKPANVEGTREIIKFATWQNLKTVHFVSTMAVTMGPPPKQRLELPLTHPSMEVIDPSVYIGGYAQSKWVAEHLVWAAHAQGLPVIVYRCGFIGCHSTLRHFNSTDMMGHILRYYTELGFIPVQEEMAANSNVDAAIYYGELDFNSKAIVRIATAQTPSHIGKAFHIFEHVMTPDKVMGLLKSERNVGQVSLEEWEEKVSVFLTDEKNLKGGKFSKEGFDLLVKQVKQGAERLGKGSESEVATEPISNLNLRKALGMNEPDEVEGIQQVKRYINLVLE